MPRGSAGAAARWCSHWCRIATASRVTEVDVAVGGDTDLLPVAHLDALIPGQGGSEDVGDGLSLLGERVVDLFGFVAIGEVHQRRVASGALDQSSDR